MADGDPLRAPLPAGGLRGAARLDGLDALEARLSHRFRRKALLEEALAPRSAGRVRDGRAVTNERLEFLGDRVLALVIAEWLMERFPDENEGALSRRLASLVRRDSLVSVAEGIALDDALPAGSSPEDARGRANRLADACEAVIGALYLDGGIATAASFIRGAWDSLLDEASRPPKDSRTALQERVQSMGKPLPAYETVKVEGPDHAPRFRIRVSVAGAPPAEGEGPTKQAASEAAAKAMLHWLVGDI